MKFRVGLAFFVGAVAGAALISAGVWYAVDQKYLMTRDLTRDQFAAQRSERYFEVWSEMAALWDGTCEIEFDADGEPVFVNGDQPFDYEVNGIPVIQREVIGAASNLGDKYALKCMLIYDSLGDMPSRRYGALLAAEYFGVDVPEELLDEAEASVKDRSEAFFARLINRDAFDAAARAYARERSVEATANSPAIRKPDLSGDKFLHEADVQIIVLDALRDVRASRY